MQIVYGVENTEIGTENILILTYQTIKVGFLMIHANKTVKKVLGKIFVKSSFHWLELLMFIIHFP